MNNLVRTEDLIGPALNWAVAKCESLEVSRSNGGSLVFDSYKDCPEGAINEYNDGRWHIYHPSTNWAQAGPIIEREKIQLSFEEECAWYSFPASPAWIAMIGEGCDTRSSTSPDALVAAMRCYVASKIGNEVQIPEEMK